MTKKKLLSFDDLYNFYLNQNKNCTFSADESGYQISVRVPAQFEVDDEYTDDTLMYCKVKLMHSGENRNHSDVTDEALHKAAQTLAYKPLLANFMEYEDEETGETLKDFTSHDMEIDEDGNTIYIEKQIGCFTADEPTFEVEEETGHNFLYGRCAISRVYTDACSIIERKNGTKVSVELAVNALEYDAKSKVLKLTDVIILGATCLGRDPKTGAQVGEGMLNARLDIEDFSVENNSVFAHFDSQMSEIQERLKKLESACFDNNEGKEDEIEVEQQNNFEEVTETEEVEVTETEETTEEEVTVTENENESGEADDETSEETETEAKETEVQAEENEVENNSSVEYSYSVNGEVKKFAISLQDKIYALHNLVNQVYGEQDNTYYSVTAYDDYVVMQDWWNDKYFKQSYTSENDSYSLVGDRVQVYVEYVTADEQKELDDMRAEYTELKEFKATVEKNQLHEQRASVLNDEKYSVLAENTQFAELKENMDNYSLTDLEKEAKVIFADYVASVGSFSAKENKAKNTVVFMANSNAEAETKKKSPYGGIFDKYDK